MRVSDQAAQPIVEVVQRCFDSVCVAVPNAVQRIAQQFSLPFQLLQDAPGDDKDFVTHALFPQPHAWPAVRRLAFRLEDDAGSFKGSPDAVEVVRDRCTLARLKLRQRGAGNASGFGKLRLRPVDKRATGTRLGWVYRQFE